MVENNYNSMQANMGIFPGNMGVTGLSTPSPADTSFRLMEQATQRVAQSHQALQTTPMLAAQTFGAQYQRQFQQAQSMQSMSPFQAQAYPGSSFFNTGTPYLPSPITMTPASTGVFRPPMPMPTMPIPPMYTPPIIPSPFHANVPSPMFQTPWEQQAITRDLQSNRMFSYAMQVPSAAGQALGIGAGALAGARMLGGLGPMGTLAGAVGGGLLAGGSGLSDMMGSLAQLPFQPMIESRQMGAALQRMSQNWVVSGPQLHATGRGLNQQAGIELAGELKDLATSPGFRKQTGGMFNREDLMRMTQLSGQAGLLDMSQSVPAIRAQMRQVVTTVKSFMELTNDPDVTNVIREMGQMRQYGMNMPQIKQAAENMRMFSRAAGTSVAGLREMGGMPGAMVYQGMGLSAAQGFEYGNYSLAMARQLVASGGIGDRQLAMLGGVQGIAQRNMQAQAAFVSTPMFAAANAQFGIGGWEAGENPARMGGGRGAFGMVNSAVSNLNAAVRRGGVGALITFPMQQQEIADEAASKMTPMEQTAQRFRMARETGSRFGLRGEAAFAMGARMLYGDEVANQMLIQAKDPGSWTNQKQMFERRSFELALEQRQRLESSVPNLALRTGRALGITDLSKAVGHQFSVTGGHKADWMTTLGDFISEPEGVSRFRARRGTSMTSAQAKALRGENFDKFGISAGTASDVTKGFWSEWDRFRYGYESYSEGRGLAGATETALSTGGIVLPISNNAMKAFGGMVFSQVTGMSDDQLSRVIATRNREMDTTNRIIERAQKVGGNLKDITAASVGLGKYLPKNLGTGAASSILTAASSILATKAKDYIGTPNKMGQREYIESLKAASKQLGIDPSYIDKMPPGMLEQTLSQVAAGAIASSPEVNKIITVDTYGGNRKEILEQVDRVTKNLQDKNSEDIKDLEEKVFGNTKTFMEGALETGSFGLYSAEGVMAGVKDWAKGTNSEAVAVAAALATGDVREIEKARKWFKSQGKGRTDEQWIALKEAAMKNLNAMTGDQRQALAGAGKGDLNKVQEWAQRSKYEGVTKSVRSEAFLGDFMKFSGGVGAAWRGEGGDISNVRDVAAKMSEAELGEMEKSGNVSQRRKAKLLRKVKAGDRSAESQLMVIAALEGGSEVEDRSLTKATGPSAEAAEKSADAASELAAAATDFSPAVKDFHKAAKILLEAAEIQQNNVRQGRE